MPQFRQILRRFRRDETGSVTFETLIMLPILVWFFIASFVLFDAFNVQSRNIKAGYTIGDILSRETGYVTDDYIAGLEELHAVLLRSDSNRAMQITVYSWDQSRAIYRVRWSRATGGLQPLTDTTLADFAERLPIMPNGEVAILVRSRLGYVPLIDVGVPAFNFDEINVTRPRFAPQVCWNTSPTAPARTAVC